MKIGEETVAKIREAVDIVEVVGEYVQLKKQGRSYFGLCPFHGEKTPSFSVSPEKQIFYCFGCQTGGNVYTFMMEIEGLSFLEACTHLAEKAGIPLQVDGSEQTGGKRARQRKTLLDAHELLTQFYHYCLTKTNAGRTAREYLKNRGFSLETLAAFRVGYAPDSWEVAANLLQKRGYSLEEMATCGLVSRRQNGEQFFDKFRDRVICPILDASGKPIAFSGRKLSQNEKEPKYLNSPETVIFRKSRMLYGFHLARQTIRRTKRAVLLEGNLDVIKAHQIGIDNAVASLGTSLTAYQAEELARIADTVVVCYDGDQAGVNAALRAAEVLEEAGCYVKIAQLPENQDPDDYIDRHGGERFRALLEQSATVTSFKLDFYRKGKNLNDDAERLQYIEKALEVISGLKKAVERDHYLRRLAEEFSLSLDALKQQQYTVYRRLRKNQNDAARYDKSGQIDLSHTRLLPSYINAERYLLAHMMAHRDVAERVQREIGTSFSQEEHGAIAAYLYAYYAEDHPAEAASFLGWLSDQSLVPVATEIAMLPTPKNVSEKEIADYIKQVILFPKREEVRKLEEKRKQTDDAVAAARIAQAIQNLKREIKKIQRATS